MLNRRHLRMKVMQALYGFEQAKGAHYQLCTDKLKHAFDPDWNDERSESLNAERVDKAKEAVRIFRQHYMQEDWLDTTLAPDVRRTIQQTIKEYHINIQAERKGFQNGLIRDVNKLYDNYLLILALPNVFADLVKADREGLRKSYMRKDDQTGDFKFIDNQVVKFLAQCEPLQLELKRRNLSWATHEVALRDFYLNIFRQDKTYQQYNSSKFINFEEEREIVAAIYRNLVFTQQNLTFFSLKEFDIKRFGLEKLAKEQDMESIRLQILKVADETLKQHATTIGVSATEVHDWAEAFQKHLKEFASHLQKTQNDQEQSQQELQNKKEKEDHARTKPQERESDVIERRFTQDVRRLHALLREATQELVGKLSLAMETVGKNLLDNQRINTDAIEIAIHDLLKAFGMGNHSEDKITLQIENEKESSLLQDLLQEMDYNWLENGKVIQNMVMKTVKMFDKPVPTNFKLIELSANWDEDKQFYQDLFQQTIEYDEQAMQQLSDKTQNWDVARMAELDRIIMKMAIAEMVHFTSIPVKVTINEYLEIAKLYSTPRSKPFINGLLDQIAQSMQEDGSIRKSGRGLMDNK